MIFSTIAAISTPPGKGGVALLRVSGPEAFSVAEKTFRPKDGKPLSNHPFRCQIYGDILSFSDGEVLDDGLLTRFSAPSSFTGEDVVEITCHGGEVITSMVLSSLLSAGAVMAKPGEFSRRAFLNGKLSLTAAEGVADLLDAKTEEAALLSSKTSRGSLSEKIDAVSKDLLSVSASLWAYLDYPEEDLQTLSDEETLSRLDKCVLFCEELIASFRMGRVVQSGLRAVIAGKPNAGKSTFFNLLLGEDRAIVTEKPGTTRDVIEYPVRAGRVLLNLSDTAGVRSKTPDEVEKIGIERAMTALREAELVFALFDLSRPLEEEDRIVLSQIKSLSPDVYVIPIFTKSDLPRKLDSGEIVSALGEGFTVSFRESFKPDVIFYAVENRYISDDKALRAGHVLTSARQKGQITKCRDLLLSAKEELLSGYKDIASLTLEEALGALLETDSKSAGEKILDEVFSRFCIGK